MRCCQPEARCCAATVPDAVAGLPTAKTHTYRHHGMRSVVALAVTAYKYCISPFLPPGCRFRPTCSEYAKEAVVRFGVFKGGLLAAFRLARCNPLCKAGFDPVPEAFPAFFPIKQAHLPQRKTRSQ